MTKEPNRLMAKRMRDDPEFRALAICVRALTDLVEEGWGRDRIINYLTARFTASSSQCDRR